MKLGDMLLTILIHMPFVLVCGREVSVYRIE